SVGFEYESCPGLVLWERRTSTLQGFEPDASNMGGWTLDKHHILDLQNGEMLLHPVILSLFFSQLSSSAAFCF
ncbi:teneurin-3, partial [Tachysurus ichikawai]